jgi:hypothetical protein
MLFCTALRITVLALNEGFGALSSTAFALKSPSAKEAETGRYLMMPVASL